MGRWKMGMTDPRRQAMHLLFHHGQCRSTVEHVYFLVFNSITPNTYYFYQNHDILLVGTTAPLSYYIQFLSLQEPRGGQPMAAHSWPAGKNKNHLKPGEARLYKYSLKNKKIRSTSLQFRLGWNYFYGPRFTSKSVAGGQKLKHLKNTARLYLLQPQAAADHRVSSLVASAASRSSLEAASKKHKQRSTKSERKKRKKENYLRYYPPWLN